MTCETCRYSEVLDDGKPHCKRYPPRALAAMPYFADGKQQCQIIIDFPTLNRNIACGEWKYRKEVCPADETV